MIKTTNAIEITSVHCDVHYSTALTCYYTSDFKRGYISILVATDVASRGIGQWNKEHHLSPSSFCRVFSTWQSINIIGL